MCVDLLSDSTARKEKEKEKQDSAVSEKNQFYNPQTLPSEAEKPEGSGRRREEREEEEEERRGSTKLHREKKQLVTSIDGM